MVVKPNLEAEADSRARIYQLEKTIVNQQAARGDAESSPLISDDNPDDVFRRVLDTELEKISTFYQVKELEIFGEVSELLKDAEAYETERQEQAENGETHRPGTSGRGGERPRQPMGFSQKSGSTVLARTSAGAVTGSPPSHTRRVPR